jgi:polysaccharide biosynthesis protein PslG
MVHLFKRCPIMLHVVLLATLLCISACQTAPAVTENATPAPRATQATPLPADGSKPVSFAVLEDYDKGDDLEDIARDFELMQELGVDTMRCSFGWDDYEPSPGQYDFAWLEQFAAKAAEYDIKLRPYIAYTPAWAGRSGGGDSDDWNNPPKDYAQWYNFVYNLAAALSDHPNVLSYEIYNEVNADQWWDGTNAQYKETLIQGARAVRAADPDAQVLLSGLTYPDDDWLRPLASDGIAQYYDITPLHVYSESWSTEAVEDYLSRQYHEDFVPVNNTTGEGEPIWANEIGYATTPGKTEEQQAYWWVRAVSTLLADPEIEHIGIYEIKDLPQGSAVIGDSVNYHLGITNVDRTKKLAFHTLDMLTDLLDTGTLTVADDEATVTVTSGEARRLYHHLFVRPDGRQVLFVYDKQGTPTVRVSLQRAGKTATKYEFDGSSAPVTSFDGTTLDGIELKPGTVAIFSIDP